MNTRKEGAPFILAAVGLGFVAGMAGWHFMATLLVAAALFLVLFFRDPHRDVPPISNALVSPADGKVVVAEDGQEGMRLAIFMSIFDCHVNRAPIKGEVVEIRRERGGFASANLPQAAKNNRVVIVFKTDTGETFTLSQISGMVARRIRCWLSVGDVVDGGERIGMIVFGSRVELEMPAGFCQFTVKQGDKVKAGESIIGRKGS